MTIHETTCVICRQPEPRQGQVCDSCRTGLAADIVTVGELAAELQVAEDLVVDVRMRLAVDDDGVPIRDRKGRQLVSAVPCDPVAHLLAGGPVRAATTQSRVRAHRARSAPVNLTTVDLTLPVYRRGVLADGISDTRVPALRRVPDVIATRRLVMDPETGLADYEDVEMSIWHRQPVLDDQGQQVLVPAGDQGGSVPISHLLVLEVRSWMDGGAPASYLPAPTIPVMLAWLGVRLDWACDNLPGIVATADTLSTIIGKARAALGENDVEDKLPYVTCPRCGTIGLYRTHGEELIRCMICPALLTRREYDAHAREQAGATA